MATSCTELNDLYKDVEYCRGKKNLPGLRPLAYFIRKSDITSWPAIADSPADLAAVATLAGNFELSADKTWNKIDLVPDEQELNSESAGSFGAKTFNVTCTLVVPGSSEEVSGLATELNNDDVVFLVPQRDGKYRLVGNEAFTVNVAVAQASGKGSDDSNATTLTLTVQDEVCAPFYPGNILTSDGTISGATGKVATTA